MPPLINYMLLACVVLYAALLLGEAVLGLNRRSIAWEGALLILFVATLRVTTGFPLPVQAFGGFSPMAAVGIMFASVLVGIAARYIFYRQGRYTWRSFLKPLVISPIVLLPLLGSLQGVAALEPVQLISFALLSFQNGFFWETVIERVKP